ncbi:MAG TPA: peptidylprolyl isomerase [Candidatus Nanoarchaeia archaeon]|nr:peptidylprolyl isomerase [Candidatus Nanoarchaeia archaeon]
MAIKKDDFVELDYTAKLKDTNEVFDTTSLEVAKKAGLKTQDLRFAPVIAKVGSRTVIPGLDAALVGKEPGKFSVDLQPEQAFGKKDPKFIQLVNTAKFIEQKIQPVIGLQVNIEGHIGTIRSVTGGRTMVDFNHPLSGREISYDVTIKRIVTDKKEQAKAAFEWMRFMPREWDIKGDKAVVMVAKPVPDTVKNPVTAQFKHFTGMDLEFELRKQDLAEEKSPSANSSPDAKVQKPKAQKKLTD